MKQASSHFTDDDRRRINAAVAEAETGTDAEIVPVVATVSGRYDRAEDVFGLWCGILLACVAWWLVPEPVTESGAWGGTPAWLKLVSLIAAVIVGFIAGAVVASRIGWLRRLLSPRGQMRDEVEAAARRAFFDSRVRHTARGTGVLIYVSLQERMASVLADQGALEKLGGKAVAELRDELVASLRKGAVAEALCGAVRSAGTRLAAVLPAERDNPNELPDALVVIDAV